MPHLDDFPELKQWYLKNHDIGPSFAEDPVEYTVCQFCLALSLPKAKAMQVWSRVLARFLEHIEAMPADFREMERFFEHAKAPLDQILSAWGYEAFDLGREDEFFLLMEEAASKTKLVSFYFLAAWAAFNQDDYKACVDLCDLVKGSHAPILTLKGQALLESGKPKESIAVLIDAISIDDREFLAWFQLAKSHWVAGEHANAFKALEACSRIIGPNHELATFMAIIALEAPFSFSWHEKAWNQMLRFMSQLAGNEEYVEKLISLAVRANRLDWMEIVASEADWQSLKRGLLATRRLGVILRSLGERQWHELTSKILGHLIEDGL